MSPARTATTSDPEKFQPLQQSITHIAPTRPGMSWLAWLFLSLLRRISKLTMARQLEFIHFAQWQRVRSKKLPRLAPGQPAEDFANDFFLFTTNYNGDWDQYIDTFARVPHIRRGMWWLWRFCQGYPGPIPLRNFKQYIHYQTYPDTLYYTAYPASTVRNIEAALAVKQQIQAFAAASPPTETPAAFKQRYVAMTKAIAPYLGSAPARSPFKVAAYEPTAFAPATPRAFLGRLSEQRARGPLLGRLAGPGGVGQTNFAAMSPIEVKPAHEVTTAITELVTTLSGSQSASPFAQCPMLHMARLVVIDDLRPKLGTSPTASLRTNYLLFVASIDGQLDDFLDCLSAADPSFVQQVWGRCLGYPVDPQGEPRQGPVFLRRYIARSLLPVHLPFVAFPGHTALDIRGAVSIHADVLDWMGNVRNSQMSDDKLKDAWQGWLDHLFDEKLDSR